MEVCYQLPVLPLDRPVPKHVLSRRGAISFSSSSSLFGAPDPRQLSQVNDEKEKKSILHICVFLLSMRCVLAITRAFKPAVFTTNIESTGISQVVVRYLGPNTQ